MSTVQIAGITVACLILVALVVSLIITRRKDKAVAASAPEEQAAGASFFDEGPRDQFDKLGKREVSAGEAAGATEVEVPAAAPADSAPSMPDAGDVAGAALVAPTAPATGAGATADLRVRIEATRHAVKEALDRPFLGESGEAHVAAEPIIQAAAEVAALPVVTAGSEEAGAETTDSLLRRPGSAGLEEPPVEAATSEPTPEPAEAVPAAVAACEPGRQIAPQSTVPPVTPAAEAGATPATVPLSQVLLTTNEQHIDLGDPDVRRMLKDLVKNEIDLAAQYRGLGRFDEAVAPLTEAEKICTALGLTSQAALVRAMIAELQRAAGRSS